ncbi:MAG: NYN domain-containing protein [Zymomonas mobilis]|uniref:NYN domain-containing protein n=1 Tax=Zymomonas mobilis TaxID=542 RepID=UPI0039E7D56C
MTQKTFVYVDGFNLYYRLLKRNPEFKWLNLNQLAHILLPNAQIEKINYYTARVSGRVDETAPKDQNTYLSALKTLPNLDIHYGQFAVHPQRAFLEQPIQFFPDCPINFPKDNIPAFVSILKTEEKGSDVNLGAHLVRDGCLKKFDRAAIITNDTDLCEPVRIVTKELGLHVTLLAPSYNPTRSLKDLATDVRHIRPQHLKKSQFPDRIGQLKKPVGWVKK